MYEEYAAVCGKIKALEAIKEELAEKILADMESKGETKTDAGYGKFTVTMVKKWTYPESVTELGEEFKAAKAKAESTGDATCVETPSLRFTTAKI